MKDYAVFIIAVSAIPEVVEVGSDRYNELVASSKNHLVGPKDQCEIIAKDIKEIVEIN